jgi:hypothetical protein
MSQGFAGSVVLTQDSAGVSDLHLILRLGLTQLQHCSISGPSICTQKYIRKYFLDGTLPEPGTICPVITSPFPTGDLWAAGDAQAVFSLSAADRTLLEAVRELATTIDFQLPLGL